MKSSEEIEALAKQMAFEPEATAEHRILAAAEAALDRRTDTARVLPTCFLGRQIMKTPWAKLSIAATLVVAVLLGLYLLNHTSNIAWANVLMKVSAFETCVCRVREVTTDGPRPDGFEFPTESSSTWYYSSVYGGVHETYQNDELFTRNYTSLRSNESVTVCYPLESYLRRPLTAEQVNAFYRKYPQQIVANILEGPYKELGEETIDGIRVMGVELRDPGAFVEGDEPAPDLDEFVARFWIDMETELPVWVEVDVVRAGSSTRRMMIVDQFEWGLPLEAALFEPNIPATFELDDPDAQRVYTDSAPKTETAETFAAQTQAEPYLGDFDDLTVPDVKPLRLLGVDTTTPQTYLRLRNHKEIWQAQDAVMAAWPRYEDVQDQLADELQTALGIEQMTVDELVGLGIALRERFWELRGCLSSVSYPYGYAARLVTAMAHEQAPDDSAVTDQYVESIETCEVTKTYHDDENARIPNPVYPGLLTTLRAEQFEQIKTKVAQGAVPTWKDFVRAHDLVILLSSNCDDCEGAREVTHWMIEQATSAGWTYYVDTQLVEMEEAYAAGDQYRCGLFMSGPNSYPEEYRYGRRLFSFQGPRQRAAGLLPIHLRHLKGW